MYWLYYVTVFTDFIMKCVAIKAMSREMRHDWERSHALLCCCLCRRHFLNYRHPLGDVVSQRASMYASFFEPHYGTSVLVRHLPPPLEANLSTSKQYLRLQGECRVRVIYIVYASERSGTAVWLSSYNTVTKKWIEMDRIDEWVISQIICTLLQK